MTSFTDRLIALIDRVLWASRMDSLTSPTFWGRCSHCGETSPWITSVRETAGTCTPCDHDARREHEAHREQAVHHVVDAGRLAHA